jgi:hypothetical protein
MCVSKMSVLSCCEQTFCYHFLLLKTRKIKHFELMEQNDLGRIIPVGIALGCKQKSTGLMEQCVLDTNAGK